MARRNQQEGGPGQPLAHPQASLASGAHPKTDSEGADFHGVAIAQNRFLNGQAVDGGESRRVRAQNKSARRINGEFQVDIPDSFLLALQVRRRSPNLKRKMADNPFGARHFSGKDFQLNHYSNRIRFLTWIMSPGTISRLSSGLVSAFLQSTTLLDLSLRVT